MVEKGSEEIKVYEIFSALRIALYHYIRENTALLKGIHMNAFLFAKNCVGFKVGCSRVNSEIVFVKNLSVHL
ncbi:hypothetical protein [Priestia megaterium]|uniref:hypothetical protein n=1 Tax=Priestia megaterium TaxID=1404 RepID=UPI002E1CE205|nr:hypothetical protein [Priestia megaterium]